jgi:hypothetical protein
MKKQSRFQHCCYELRYRADIFRVRIYSKVVHISTCFLAEALHSIQLFVQHTDILRRHLTAYIVLG